MNLVIVESPAKAKTIEKYLGKDFKVLASFGHVRDLPVKTLGVDTKNDFEPEYEIPGKAKKVVSDIKKAVDSTTDLYLATDLDREGEAISWHLIHALKLKEDDKKIKRITFSEITKTALEHAVKNPRAIDINLVNAQQARRVLDRLVGYKLSPLLWKKVKTGLSAGRVQSVTVRLVVEREREIKGFKAEEYWIMAVDLSKKDDEQVFRAFLIERGGKPVGKMDVKSKKDSDTIIKALEDAKYTVISVEKKDGFRKAPAPFVTSTLQMEASRKMGYSAKQTMMLAQKLYEAGHITYMRTDSVNLSESAIKSIREVVKDKYGDKYLPAAPNQFAARGKRAQEAHEAIRPTDFREDKTSDDGREQKLYDLIWKRAVASQMSDAKVEVIEAKISAKALPPHPTSPRAGEENFIFMAKGQTLKFEGYIKLYTEGQDDEMAEDDSRILPPLEKNEILKFIELISDQKFTEPPKRYTEAMLVKKLESMDIGRPSTYAPTLSTIQDRGYVELEEKRFKPTEIAEIVNDLLVEHFDDVVDYQFTANMEDELDDIAEGKREWVPVIREFYDPFEKKLAVKNKELEKKDFIKDEPTKEKCPDCGKPIVIKLGRFGKFMACSGYPECKYSKPLETKEDKKTDVVVQDGEAQNVAKEEIKCEKCGGNMITKEGRFGKFLACENYPKCKNTLSISTSTGMKCPDCKEGDVIERRTKKGRQFWGCSAYPKCEYASWENPTIKKEEAVEGETKE